VGGADNCTTGQNATLADLAVLSICQRQQSDHLSDRFKRVFLWGMYKQKGLDLLWAEKKLPDV